MTYDHPAIPEPAIPRGAPAAFAHVVEIYGSETNKVAAVWREFSDPDLDFRPDLLSRTVGEIMKHQLLSERRFFSEFLAHPEPPATEILPGELSVEAFIARFAQLATPRLAFLADRSQEWWLESAPFFDVRREHIWIFWRRILHTAHHRTQLSVYLRLIGKAVPQTYGPTADAP